MMKKIYPGWMSRDFPKPIMQISGDEAKGTVSRFSFLTEERDYKGIRLPWPRDSLRTVAIQDGFDLSEKNAKNLDTFFNECCPSGVLFWPTFDKKAGFYKADYSADVREWIGRELIISPVSMIGIDVDVVLVIDEMLSYTLIGGPESVIAKLELLYGGADMMEKSFIDSLEEYYPDPSETDYLWITQAVLAACKWGGK